MKVKKFNFKKLHLLWIKVEVLPVFAHLQNYEVQQRRPQGVDLFKIIHSTQSTHAVRIFKNLNFIINIDFAPPQKNNRKSKARQSAGDMDFIGASCIFL